MACALAAVVGCGSESSDDASGSATSTTTAQGKTSATAGGQWGVYPADASLDEQGVVAAYVQALDRRDGKRFCSLVVPWISGRFDLAGTDPDANISRRIRCPVVIPAIMGFPWENRDRFKGARIEEFGASQRRGELVSVAIKATVRFENERDAVYEESLDDVVWLVRDSGAWRVAKLSYVARAAALGLPWEGADPPGRVEDPPDLEADRRAFAAVVSAEERRRRERKQAYRQVTAEVSCSGAKRYADGGRDVQDYRHPAPATPTPQLGAADIRAVEVAASRDRICVVFELSGDVRTDTTFEFAIESNDFDWGTAGFAQGFEVELRGDGRARVTSGEDDKDRPLSVPGTVGRRGNRLSLVVDRSSFASGRPFPGSEARAGPLESFRFRADVTVVLSERRQLHDELGPPPPEGGKRFSYP